MGLPSAAHRPDDERESSGREEKGLDANRCIFGPRKDRPSEYADDRQQPEQCNQEVPLGHERERTDRARRAVVERLKEVATPRPIADAPSPPARGSGVHPPFPGEMTASVVLGGPLALEQCLGLAVLRLLPQVAADRAPPSVEHDRGGAEPDRPAPILKPPADVDVVAGDSEL